MRRKGGTGGGEGRREKGEWRREGGEGERRKGRGGLWRKGEGVRKGTRKRKRLFWYMSSRQLTVLLMPAKTFPLNSTSEYTAPLTSLSATWTSLPWKQKQKKSFRLSKALMVFLKVLWNCLSIKKKTTTIWQTDWQTNWLIDSRKPSSPSKSWNKIKRPVFGSASSGKTYAVPTQ